MYARRLSSEGRMSNKRRYSKKLHSYNKYRTISLSKYILRREEDKYKRCNLKGTKKGMIATNIESPILKYECRRVTRAISKGRYSFKAKSLEPLSLSYITRHDVGQQTLVIEKCIQYGDRVAEKRRFRVRGNK